MKISLVNLVLLFSVALVLTGITEVVLRATHLFGARVSWATPDSLVGWRNVPNATYWHFQENDHPITGSFNRHGWRDKEWTLEKGSNEFRIALLGDSYVEAFQIESHKTFQAMVQKRLNDTMSLNVELMNFGQSGFTQSEEYIILQKEVIRFDPDMVILFFLPGNDIDDISRETASSVLRPFYQITENGELQLDTSFNQDPLFKIKSLISPLKKHSIIVSFLAEQFNYIRKRARRNLSRKSDSKIVGYHSLATANPDDLYTENYALNKILIRKMADFCRERGIRFMLVVLNTMAYMPEIENQYRKIDSTFDPNYFEDDLRRYTNALNIEYLGLQRVFRDHYVSTKSDLHWGHWNYEGHAVVATFLGDKLESFLSSGSDASATDLPLQE